MFAPKIGRTHSTGPMGPTGQTGVVKVNKILFGLHNWIGLLE
jgi:hypothetical protein